MGYVRCVLCKVACCSSGMCAHVCEIVSNTICCACRQQSIVSAHTCSTHNRTQQLMPGTPATCVRSKQAMQPKSTTGLLHAVAVTMVARTARLCMQGAAPLACVWLGRQTGNSDSGANKVPKAPITQRCDLPSILTQCQQQVNLSADWQLLVADWQLTLYSCARICICCILHGRSSRSTSS